jgi:hypothetical protein
LLDPDLALVKVNVFQPDLRQLGYWADSSNFTRQGRHAAALLLAKTPEINQYSDDFWKRVVAVAHRSSVLF